jgi:hypothetical protein
MNPLDHEEQEILEAFEAGARSVDKVNGHQGSAHQHSPHQ